MKRIAYVCCIAMLLVGCSQNRADRVKHVEVIENEVPGTVKEPWVEPMHDTVKVPGRLDPTGTYYRPEHSEVVEIRPGRFQQVEYPDESNVTPNVNER